MGGLTEDWEELRAAFRRDPNLHCAYAEGDEGPEAGKAGYRKLLNALSGVKAGPLLVWRGALKRRLLDYQGCVDDLSRCAPAADVLTWLGEAQLQVGRAEEGLRHMRAALKRRDARPWNRAWLGRALLTLRRDPSGLAHLDRAIAADPGNYLFLAWRGIGRLRLKIDGALEDFDEALALSRGRDAAWIRGWRALALPGKEGLKALHQAAREQPGYGPVAAGLARAKRAAGDFAGWAADLDAAARRDTKYIQSLPALERAELEGLARDLEKAGHAAGRRWLGRVLTLLGEPERALVALKRAPDDGLTRWWRGEALLLLGKAAEAEKAFAGVAPPWTAFASAGLAKARAARGDLDGALSALEEAARLDPSLASVWGDLGALKLLLGDPAGAAEALARAVGRDPRNVSAWADLSVAQKTLGRAAEARKARKSADRISKSQARERLARWARHFKPAERV